MKEKFETYVNKLFKGVRQTKDVKEAKEEIVNDLMEKYKDVKKKTKDEAKIYQLCIDGLGDLKDLVKLYKKDGSKLSKKIELPKYKLSEELINAISHGIGAGLSVVAFILCLIKSSSGLAIFSVFFYGISSFVLYLMSCLYHSFKPNNAKRIFRIFDHCSIYLLIAGTYTPLVLLILPTVVGWTIFFVVWILAIIGIVLNAIDLKKFKIVSMILYLVMGWCILFSFETLWNSMNHFGIFLLLLGGILYTIGAIIYGVGKKKKYMHSVFHIFCILASVCFFLGIYIYAL